MTEAAVIKPEDMSYEQLIEAANNEAGELAAKEEKARDEQGRFVAQGTEEPVVEAKTEVVAKTEEPAEKVVYEHVIDLEDGSGSQVFRADSMPELVEKLGEAQKHASKKIRELTQEKRAEQVVARAPTDDEEWLISQELASKPKQTLERMFEELASKRERAQREIIDRETNIGKAFVASHPEYVVNDRNGKKLDRALEISGLDRTLENLEKVYAELSADGLLAIKDADEPNTDKTVTPTSRIASSGARVVSVGGRAASGISSKRSSAPAPKPQGPTEKELYSMSYEDLERLANEEHRKQQA